MQISIISYLPDDETLRAKRKVYIRRQYDWIRSIFPSKTIRCVCQNYTKEDCIDGIDYIVSPPVGAGEARNILLREFYKSNEDYLLLMDDDQILYDYYGAFNLLKEIDENPKKFYLLDMIIGNNPIYLPFKKSNYADKTNIESYWKFRRPTSYSCGMQIAVIKNISKFSGKYIFFKDTFGKKFNEDIEFMIHWIQSGFTRYECAQWQYKDMGNQTSTLFPQGSARSAEEKQWLFNTLASYTKEMQMIYKGKANFRKIKEIDHTKKIGYIKRQEKFYFTDKEIPK